MNRLIKETEARLQRDLEQISDVILGITQEENILIGWFNDEHGSTHTIQREIPFYQSYKNISDAVSILGGK